jgi:glucose-1-phosphate cytidylyltransferase
MGELQAFKHEGFWQCMDHKIDKIKLDELCHKNKAPWLK